MTLGNVLEVRGFIAARVVLIFLRTREKSGL